MSTSRIHHLLVLSLTSTLLLPTAHCLTHRLSPRNQGTSVSPVNPTKSSSAIIPGWKDATAIVFLVAIISLVITIPMFVYIWMRRRRLHAARQRSRNQLGEAKEIPGSRKGSLASTIEIPLTAAVKKEPVGRGRRLSMGRGEDLAGRGRKPSTGRLESGPAGKKSEPVTYPQPVQISVKPIKAVEIMVKPKVTVFKDPTWERLKS